MHSVKEECLSQLMLFGEAALCRALNKYVRHYHHERNHQGKGNILRFPTAKRAPESTGAMRCYERLGGVLKYYDCAAA